MTDYRLYVVTTDLNESFDIHVDIAREAILGGATVIQFREKKGDTRDIFEAAFKIKKLTEVFKIPLIINDRVDICLAVDADGVHVGQQDMPLEVARRLLGKERIVGVTATNLEEAIEAEQQGADYLGVSPIFATPSKADAGEPMGLEMLKEIRSKVKIPIVAIGGITGENVEQVMRTGVDGIAVISAIAAASDRTIAAEKLLRQIDMCRVL